MGELGSWRGAGQGLVVCIAVSMAYAASRSLPAGCSVGRGPSAALSCCRELPSAWAQFFWGLALLVASAIFGLAMVFGERIDAAAQAWIARRLAVSRR